MTRVLIVTDDRLGASMAGPAIRAWEIAHHLAPYAEITLASTQPIGLASERVHLVATSPKSLVQLAGKHDVLMLGGLLLAQYPALAQLGKYVILDLYDPFLLEDLELLKDKGALGQLLYQEHHRKLAWQVQQADFMIAASDRQRDYWLGRLCALGRLAPDTYREDPSIERFVACVPFGISPVPPMPAAPQLRRSLGLAPTDRVFLWGGGIWDWLDPLTPIRAAAQVAKDLPALKLVFLAGRSPNPTTPEMAMATRARALAESLGVLGQSVHFYEHWIPYSERGAMLLEADAGVIAHFNQLETRFSFRTRVLDYLWTELPIITTEGDAMADLVLKEGLGEVCGYQSMEDWVRSFERLCDTSAHQAYRARFASTKERFYWDRAVEPLARYVQAPYHMPRVAQQPTWLFHEPWLSLSKAYFTVREEGWSGLEARVLRVIRRRTASNG